MRPPSSDTPSRRTPASAAHPPASRWNASRPFSLRRLYRSDPGSRAATSSSAPSRTALSAVRRPALITTPPSWIFSCASRLRSAAVTASSASAIRRCVRRRTRRRLARRCPVSVLAKSRCQLRERRPEVLIADVEIEQAGLVGELADAALFPFLALGQLLLEVLDVGQDLCAVFPPCHGVPPGVCCFGGRSPKRPGYAGQGCDGPACNSWPRGARAKWLAQRGRVGSRSGASLWACVLRVHI